MAKPTSVDIDVDEQEAPPPKPVPKTEFVAKKPAKKVHKKAEVKKEIKVKQPDPPPPPPIEVIPAVEEKPPVQEETKKVVVVPAKKSISHTVKKVEPLIAQPTKEDLHLPFGVNVDPGTAAVVGTIAVAAAGTAAATTGVAAPMVTALKAGIIKVKTAMGLSSKAAVVAGTAAVGAVAMVALEKKFNDYEKDLQSAKEDVGDISEQLKKLDALLDNVKPKQ